MPNKTSPIKTAAITLFVLGGVAIFALLAPFLIVGAWLVVCGLIAFGIISLIVYAIFEWIKETF